MKPIKKIRWMHLVLWCLLPGFASAQVMGVSVQLWSVREAVKADIDDTLAQLAAMNFDGVEFAGEFGPYHNRPAELRARLQALGLQASGAHVNIAALSAQAYQSTVAFYRALGVTSLIVGMDERAWQPEGVAALAADLNAAAARLAPEGMQVGYHNHDGEFNAFGAATFWDYLAQHTDPSVILQQDVGWTRFAGKDPVTYVARYPGRTLTTHYKVIPPEGSELSPIIGVAPLNWRALIHANETQGGTRWLVVEQEDYPAGMTPLQAVAASKRGLDTYLAEPR